MATALASTERVSHKPNDVFAAWAEVYDEVPNPLLSLEQRLLECLLPDVSRLNVVDIGCGTGRWLEVLGRRSPRSLIGIDSSPEMLARAGHKVKNHATLRHGDALSLPLPGSSADLVLCSFLVSYVHDLKRFASEIARVTRPGARVFITDLNVHTASACGWKRAFRSRNKSVEVITCDRIARDVSAIFELQGFDTACTLEPSFGEAEKQLMVRAGKLDAFRKASGRPVIYITELHRRKVAVNVATTLSKPTVILTNTRVATGPVQTTDAEIFIDHGRIRSTAAMHHAPRRAESATAIDLSGYLLLPGLINSHDHLEFGLFPRLGRGPYANAHDWAADIQKNNADLIALMRRVPKRGRLWWGAIRNLLSGVTTVCHHNPVSPEMLDRDFPVRVLRRFGWAHSLAFDAEVAAKYRESSTHEPFIVHLAEGTDSGSREEVFALDRMRALTPRTVIVHGLALDDQGIALLNARGSGLVWCPSSNRFLFGRTHGKTVASSIRNLVLGTDSPLTAQGDLLDEIQLARDIGLAPEILYERVLNRVARIFRLTNGEGTLEPGATADLIAVRQTNAQERPAELLTRISSVDIELVMLGGRVQLVSDDLLKRLPPELRSKLRPLEVDGRVVWIRAPLGQLFRDVSPLLGCDIRLGKKRVRNVCTSWL